MNLDETQVAKVREWIDQGLKAAEVQTRLLDELGLKMTYAEVRFLLGDLQLRPKDPPPAPKAADTVVGGGAVPAGPGGPAGGGPGGLIPPPGAGPGPLKTQPLGPGEAAPGGVSVTVDEIARPNMVVSGKVTFSDGQRAEWGIDQMGRPMLIPTKQGYRPSPPDIQEFQAQLEQLLARFGY